MRYLRTPEIIVLGYLSISGDLLPLVFVRRRRLCATQRLLAILHFKFLKTGHQMISAGIPVSLDSGKGVEMRFLTVLFTGYNM